jgi:hypothetical protein
MGHIEGSQDGDLHTEHGEHVTTARTSSGHALELHERRIRAHLDAHRRQRNEETA